MRTTLCVLATGLTAMLLATAGCNDDQVVLDDVENARVEADQAAENLREVEETAAERIREKEAELNEVVDEERERIARERAEAVEAREEANEVTTQFNTQESRDQYLEEQRIFLEDADRRIKLLDDDFGDLDVAERDTRKARFNRLHELHDEAVTKFNDLDGAEAAVWDVRQQSANDAMSRLKIALNDYERID